MQEIGHERMRDGAYAWNIFEDPDEAGRFIETSLIHSLLELEYRSARETRADELIEEHLAPFLKEPQKESYYVASKRQHHGAGAARRPRRLTARLEARRKRRRRKRFCGGGTAGMVASPRRGDRSRAARLRRLPMLNTGKGKPQLD